jgi:hypothetical protein
VVNREREVVCIELKHGSNSNGIYYGPFQAAVYRGAFLAAANSIANEIERLAKQKIALSPLPAVAVGMLRIARPTVVRAILAVVGRPFQEVQRRLRLCLECCENVEYGSYQTR